MRRQIFARDVRHWCGRALIAAAIVVVLLLPAGPFSALVPIAAAHADLVRSEPVANSIQRTPPAQVHLWFSESISPQASRVVVVNTANQEVDQQDSQVGDQGRQMWVHLTLLPAGTYVVIWRAQSTDDGHVTGGSFLFRVARPDGTVPPVPPVLPSGHLPGAGGLAAIGGAGPAGSNAALALATWLALLALTVWAGGVFWEIWILPASGNADPDLATAAKAATRRFRRLAPWALGLLLAADGAVVLVEAAELAGEWQGAVAPPLLGAILFGSRFGALWWLRQALAVAALLLVTVASRLPWRSAQVLDPGAVRSSVLGGESLAGAQPILPWGPAVWAAFRSVPRLPRRLVLGLRRCGWRERVRALLAVALLLVFALSGHAAAVPAPEVPYAVSVDMLHLVGDAVWVGGLFYISLVLVPALAGLPEGQRARVLALGLPEFSAVAIVTAVLLAATGSLNADVHLTALSQFVTTSYGRTLFIKIEFFILMVAISAYHAFALRPRLAAALRATPIVTSDATQAAREPADAARAIVGSATVGSAGKPAWAMARAGAAYPQVDPPATWDALASASDGHASVPPVRGAASFTARSAAALPPDARALMQRMENWLRREAMLGGLVLLCVALLGVQAGSLAPATTPAAAAVAGTSFTQSQHLTGGDTMTLSVTPATLGTATFRVRLASARGQPVTGVHLLVLASDRDMHMAAQTIALQPTASPGQYQGQSALTMLGHWQAVVQMQPTPGATMTSTTFTFTVGI